MIITGGIHKGRKIKTVKSRQVRPTSSKIRESIFNMIQSHIINAEMLDLFAGSGIMGLEALSRGVQKVVFVEKNRKVAQLLKENISNFNYECELIISDAVAALDKLKESSFDIIFVDPPYASGLIDPVLNKIKSNKILKSQGIIIIEHSPDVNVNETAKTLNLEIFKEKKYGDTAITILKEKDN